MDDMDLPAAHGRHGRWTEWTARGGAGRSATRCSCPSSMSSMALSMSSMGLGQLGRHGGRRRAGYRATRVEAASSPLLGRVARSGVEGEGQRPGCRRTAAAGGCRVARTDSAVDASRRKRRGRRFYPRQRQGNGSLQNSPRVAGAALACHGISTFPCGAEGTEAATRNRE